VTAADLDLREPRLPRVRIEAESPLPTRHGTFRVVVFRTDDEPETDHIAVIAGNVAGEDVLVRVHSECLTSEVLGSLKCDCAEQLDHALAGIGALQRGVVVYLRQEGRGIGLANKIRAYALQSRGLDTVDANRALGLGDDLRRYDAAAAILGWLGVRSVALVTNNPAKTGALTALGVDVKRNVPSWIAPQQHSVGYLRAKRERMGHRLPP
jgi:GTP cyclohydrolase II